MGFLLILGGVLGSIFGVEIFRIFKGMGQLELIIKLCYVIFLGVIGIIMFFESLKTLSYKSRNIKIMLEFFITPLEFYSLVRNV